MDFQVENDSARPSNLYKQEIKDAQETHLNIKSEDQEVDNFVNVFVDESETLQTLEEQSIISNDDPLSSESTVQKNKEKTEKEIDEFFRSRRINSTKPRNSVRKNWLQCPSNCYLKLTKDDVKYNFDSYWHETTPSSRFRFIYNMTEIIPTKHRFLKRKNPKYQKYQIIFFLHTKDGRGTFCKICFCRIIGERESSVDAILDEKLKEMNKISRNRRLLSWSPLSPCEDKCHLKLTEYEQRQNLFTYRKAKTYQEKIHFLRDKITMTLSTGNSDPEVAGNMEHTYFTSFSLNSKTGLKTVCHKCFRTVLNESEILIRSVLHSKGLASGNNSAIDKSAVPFSTANSDKVCKLILLNPSWEQQVRDHIKKIPKCKGHHYPGQNFETYLPMGLTLKTLYKLYRSAVCKPVDYSLYQFIFQRCNFKFRPPFLGKCEECELMIRDLRLANPEQKIELQNLLANHLAEIEGANESKCRAEIAADSSNDALIVCYFGYQQSLPTPCLNEPLAFYKRPLWTYNFTIQRYSNESLSRGNTRFYMWDESQGGKTANEMASCLYSYIKSLSRSVRSVVFCSSSACQESRSKTVSMMFSYCMVYSQTLITVEHKFLPEGHVQVAGQNFYNGERYRGKIQQPKDWYEAFSNNVGSQVWTMSSQKFYNFENLWKYPLEEGEPFIKKKVTRLLYTKNGVVCYTDNWSDDDRFVVYKFKGQSKYPILKNARLENLYNVPITETKKQDLLGLVPLLKSFSAKRFYLDLCKKENRELEPIKTIIVREEVDPNRENREVEDEEDTEPPEKKAKKISRKTDFDKFPLDIKEETIE